jgi:hypothetical protein
MSKTEAPLVDGWFYHADTDDYRHVSGGPTIYRYGGVWNVYHRPEEESEQAQGDLRQVMLDVDAGKYA